MNIDLTVARTHIERHVRFLVDDPDDQADLTQICLIKAWRRGHTFREESALNSWLYRVVYNEVADRRRRLHRRERLRREGLWTETARHEADPSGRILDRIVVERLLTGLDVLDRAMVTMCLLRDQTSSEVGAALGMASSSVRCRLHRLKKELGNGGRVGTLQQQET